MKTIRPEKQGITGRDQKGRFKSGNSGNPSGRPPLMPPEMRQRLEDASLDIITVVLDAARNGDMTAARLILERIAPVSRATAPPVAIPDFDEADGLAEKSLSVLAGVARGEVPADVGAALIQALAACVRIIESTELENRIAQLEKGTNAES